MSVEPLETSLGRKRKINQSSCNKDYACLKGFCPSFVTVEGGRLRQPPLRSAVAPTEAALAEPTLPTLARPYGVFITGVGGTGVVTIGQVLGMAAHLEGKGCSVLDMAGLAQKGGAVHSHVVLANNPEALMNTRVAMGEADLALMSDLLVGASPESLARMRAGRTQVLLNTDIAPTVEFIQNPDWRVPDRALHDDLATACGPGRVDVLDATDLAVRLLGDGIYANPLMLGYAFQKGWLPVGLAALERAIALNGIQIENNLAALSWGRRAAADLARVHATAGLSNKVSVDAMAARASELSVTDVHGSDGGAQVIEFRRGAATRSQPPLPLLSQPLPLVPAATRLSFKAPAHTDLWTSIRDDRVALLCDYQNTAYAARYVALVDDVASRELAVCGSTQMATAVARNYYKLMAYKDEYEVARLYSDGAFIKRIEDTFEGDWSLRFHLAPPMFSKRDAQGHLIKRTYGPSTLRVFGGLARLRGLRGTALDVFGYTAERRAERGLIRQYREDILAILPKLNPSTLQQAVDLASLPDEIRGYGHVKEAAMKRAAKRRLALMAGFEASLAY